MVRTFMAEITKTTVKKPSVQCMNTRCTVRYSKFTQKKQLHTDTRTIWNIIKFTIKLTL